LLGEDKSRLICKSPNPVKLQPVGKALERKLRLNRKQEELAIV
jgi:hypothetical protein